MMPYHVKAAIKQLETRVLPGGGFSPMRGDSFRSDATAWAVLALSQFNPHHTLLGPARDRLAEAQGPDGRVSMGTGHEEVFWPTALSVLAWNGSQAHERHWAQSVSFLLTTTGLHGPKTPGNPAGHDPSIPGWPWIAGTHSWVEPTALAVIALREAGRGDGDRVHQAVKMLLNRQLPGGGWNYGNLSTFGKELYPMPESTGAALAGLAGLAHQETVARSVDYLLSEVDRLCTPVSLGWALLGLAAWNRWPSNSDRLVERCFSNQTRYGEYDTSSFCLLLLGSTGEDSRRPGSTLLTVNQDRLSRDFSQ